MTGNSDSTATSGAETDIAPLGRGAAKPPHEQTVREDRDVVDWVAIGRSVEFRDLLRAKRRVIVPMTLFFVTFYFALPLSVGFLPDLMSRPILGVINLAYAFALSQFLMAWVLAAVYLRAASRWDRMAAAIAARAGAGV